MCGLPQNKPHWPMIVAMIGSPASGDIYPASKPSYEFNTSIGHPVGKCHRKFLLKAVTAANKEALTLNVLVLEKAIFHRVCHKKISCSTQNKYSFP